MFFTTCISYLLPALFAYAAIRQSCLKFCQSCICDRRVAEPEVSQAGQAFQVNQPCICDLRANEHEVCQTGQSFQVHEPGIRDLRANEHE